MAQKKSLGTPPAVKDTLHATAFPETVMDRRQLRRTDRREQLNVLVSQEFKQEYRATALKHRITTWQLLAAAMEAFKRLPEEEKSRLVEEVAKADPATYYKTR